MNILYSFIIIWNCVIQIKDNKVSINCSDSFLTLTIYKNINVTFIVFIITSSYMQEGQMNYIRMRDLYCSYKADTHSCNVCGHNHGMT